MVMLRTGRCGVMDRDLGGDLLVLLGGRRSLTPFVETILTVFDRDSRVVLAPTAIFVGSSGGGNS
jgi:hypothetical protein